MLFWIVLAITVIGIIFLIIGLITWVVSNDWFGSVGGWVAVLSMVLLLVALGLSRTLPVRNTSVGNVEVTK